MAHTEQDKVTIVKTLSDYMNTKPVGGPTITTVIKGSGD